LFRAIIRFQGAAGLGIGGRNGAGVRLLGLQKSCRALDIDVAMLSSFSDVLTGCRPNEPLVKNVKAFRLRFMKRRETI